MNIELQVKYWLDGLMEDLSTAGILMKYQISGRYPDNSGSTPDPSTAQGYFNKTLGRSNG